MTEKRNSCPWASHIGHLALVIDDIEKGKWFFGVVMQAPYYMFRETQLVVEIGPSVLVAKLSKDAVDKERQNGEMGRQVLDHYGFQAHSPEQVDAFFERVKEFSLEIIKPVYDRCDGRAFYFRDPFGNMVEYFWYNRA